MCRALFNSLTAAVALLAGIVFVPRTARAADGAFPMNVEERIQRAVDDAGEPAVSNDSSDLGKAGAYPMNVLDRINSARPPVRRSTQTQAPRQQAPAANQTTARPDAWRYRWHRNQWWYYTASNKWLYWSDSQWKPYSGMTTVSSGE